MNKDVALVGLINQTCNWIVLAAESRRLAKSLHQGYTRPQVRNHRLIKIEVNFFKHYLYSTP